MDKKKKDPNNVVEYTKDVFMTNPVASMQDCTGITQTIPRTDDEAESIANLVNVPVTAHDVKRVFPKGHAKPE